MKRMMVPVGQFVASCHPKLKPDRVNVECFTVTAYDPVMGQYIAMGHSSPELLVGKILYRADGVIPDEGESVTDVVPKAEDMIGIVTRQSPAGVSGPFYGDVGGAMLTADPKPGKAWLITSLAPAGGLDVEIITVYSTGNFTFKVNGRCVSGMSGSPITQGGFIVGALWGSSGKLCEGKSIESMADGLLDAWANDPKQNPQKRVRKVSNRTIRREIRDLTKKVAEVQVAAVGEILGPEAAKKVKKAVENSGVAAGNAVIKAMRGAKKNG